MNTQTHKGPPLEETLKMAQAAALFAKGFSTTPALFSKNGPQRVAANGR